MAIVAGFDVRRAQITVDALNTDTGEVLRGRMRSDRGAVSEWVSQFAGEHVEVAVEACTGWLFVYEQLATAGTVVPLLATRAKSRSPEMARSARSAPSSLSASAAFPVAARYLVSVSVLV